MAHFRSPLKDASPVAQRRSMRFVAQLAIESPEFVDTAVCLVVRRKPFTVLVPSHALTALEEGLARSIRIDGHRQIGAEIVPCAALERDHLSLVRFQERAPSRLAPARFPRVPVAAIPGQNAALIGPGKDSHQRHTGTLVEAKLQGSHVTLRTDIAVLPGQSGSPLFVQQRLCGICMGREQNDHAVAIRLSHEALTELRRIQFEWARNLLPVGVCLASLGMAAVSARLAGAVLSFVFALLVIRSWTGFSLASVEGPPNKPSPRGLFATSLTASNGHTLSLRKTWTRSFDTCISWWKLFPSSVGGESDHIVVGTRNEDGTPAYVHLLDRHGRTLWKYTVPDGECVYNGVENFDGYHVYRVFAADLTGDGRSEIIASFIHNNWYPSKLVVFRLDGSILGEYWHPGYLRTAGVGYVGKEPEPILIVTGCNNRLRSSPEEPVNPRVVFAFRGAQLRGQAPPYTGHGPKGNELWYHIIPSVVPGTEIDCAETLFADSNGDGLNEIRLKTEDGRYYYLDHDGKILRTDVGDDYRLAYGHGDLPPLLPVELAGSGETGGLPH